MICLISQFLNIVFPNSSLTYLNIVSCNILKYMICYISQFFEYFFQTATVVLSLLCATTTSFGSPASRNPDPVLPTSETAGFVERNNEIESKRVERDTSPTPAYRLADEVENAATAIFEEYVSNCNINHITRFKYMMENLFKSRSDWLFW